MNIHSRIMIAAPKSGSGKTTITCGLLAALKARGMNPCSFKCGPDYIDPMFHRNVIGIPSGNLDTFFTDDATTRRVFAKEYSGNIAIIEGVMGLYDGIGGTEPTGSSYDLARALLCPIVLVVDAKGAGRSVIAEIKGFMAYDKYHLIQGIILNRTNPEFGKKLGAIIEKELRIKYLGAVPQTEDGEFGSRHLGLILPYEIQALSEKLQGIANLLEENIDIFSIQQIATAAFKLEIKEYSEEVHMGVGPGLRLAVASDEAFCFYYRENLEMLAEAGVELVDFSPLRDTHLPENIQGILLGGGYPENFLKELALNAYIAREIKSALQSGMPIIAECGGFMYLMDSITDSENRKYEMVGAIPGAARFVGKLVRFGYVAVQDGEMQIKGHEFHYFDTDNNGEDCLAIKPTGDKAWNCIHKIGGSYLGFPHLYYPSNPEFVKNFVEAMKLYGER